MKIVILHHKHTDLEKSPCLLNYCSQNWIQQGHSVIHVFGIDGSAPVADVLILHVNMTVVPQEYVQFTKQYPVVINRDVIDISKSTFSTIIITRNDPYNGPVIVKTKNNYGGLPERQISKLERRRGLKDIVQYIRQQYTWIRPWHRTEWLKNYPVFNTVQKVPQGVWQNENLVVEKFMPERNKDGHYCVREWVFLGDREVHFMNISSEPVIKGTNTDRKEYFSTDEVPAELRKIRSRLGFDYGKFDYAIHNGKPVLYDVNKTPGAPYNLLDRPEATENIRQLSFGLEFYK